VSLPLDDKPIFSSRADDLDQRDAIDQFVIGLAERVDRLQDADSVGRLDELSDVAHKLAAEALANGFELLAQAAERVARHGRDNRGRDVHAELIELSHLAQRVRRGHRGAL
jgi:hypothetical protein